MIKAVFESIRCNLSGYYLVHFYCGHIRNTVTYLQKQVVGELKRVYGSVAAIEGEVSLPVVLSKVSEETGQKFIVIIDEWDALFREAKDATELQKEYIQLLRGMFKSSQTDKMIEAAYMTGILPIMIIELKWNKSVDGAIAQIKERNYSQVFEGYGSNILLVGINYDEKTKKHRCKIEKINKVQAG